VVRVLLFRLFLSSNNVHRSVTHIIRADVRTPLHHPSTTEHASTVLHAVGRIVASSTESDVLRTQAAFILSEYNNYPRSQGISRLCKPDYLVTDDAAFCSLAFEHRVLSKLAAVITSITPAAPRPEGWDEAESATIGALREACLTALASLALQDQQVRGALLDTPGMPDALHAALTHASHTGSRYAACHCVRALSRAVSVVRTSLFDSGLGLTAIGIVLRARPDEDRRVLWAALAAVCNLVIDFSPLREVSEFRALLVLLIWNGRAGNTQG
jgi:armadillo repeat-containing protein 8